ncbi:MAG TPA: site-2 protease family protein [Candidatus Woesebacteria bacterium]|nr:site-2 protease family protein [Candidatus Woesebacteria bacterium]HRT40302.1 site-2 protease family protein [Candidatus Woesebacteria bacterium]
MANFLNGINSVIALIIAITIHEFSHAYVADHLGDPTPRSAGRLSLNPLAHLDPLGTLMLFLAGFGWGKPVPIDPYNFRHPRRDSALVSVAGPVSNLIFAVLITLIAKFFYIPLFGILIFINISLAVFNLLPFHPLDGSHIFPDLFPGRSGMIILILLILPLFQGTALISYLLFPIINFCLKLLSFL